MGLILNVQVVAGMLIIQPQIERYNILDLGDNVNLSGGLTPFKKKLKYSLTGNTNEAVKEINILVDKFSKELEQLHLYVDIRINNPYRV